MFTTTGKNIILNQSQTSAFQLNSIAGTYIIRAERDERFVITVFLNLSGKKTNAFLKPNTSHVPTKIYREQILFQWNFNISSVQMRNESMMFSLTPIRNQLVTISVVTGYDNRRWSIPWYKHVINNTISLDIFFTNLLCLNSDIRPNWLICTEQLVWTIRLNIYRRMVFCAIRH